MISRALITVIYYYKNENRQSVDLAPAALGVPQRSSGQSDNLLRTHLI